MVAAALGAVSAEQHADIKKAIHAHLKDNDVFSSLKDIVASVLGGNGPVSSSTGNDDTAMAAAQHKAAVARILADEVSGAASSPTRPLGGAEPKTLLHLLLLGGRAFADPAAEPTADEMAAGDTVCVCVHFGAQRFRSQAVPFAAEPALRDGILLELPPPDAATTQAMAEAAHPSDANVELLRGAFRTGEPMHVLVLKRQARDGRETLLSSCMLEWRSVLHQGRHSLSLELPGVGAEATLPVGALEVKLELLPHPPRESRLTEAEVFVGLKRHREAQVEIERKFFAYARSWWATYVSLSPQHAQRPVKLFALSELGTQRPVSAFVTPLRAGRLLETPLHAAHYVSLIAHTRDPSAGASTGDMWRTVHATLATRSGETEEHATLLCSLLLGFGLDAYVCIGTDAKGPHVWVMSKAASGEITFWESLSGQQYILHGRGASGRAHPYLTLACVFSHAAFYANIQPSTALTHTSIDLSEATCWRSLDPMLLQSVTPLPCAPLQPSMLTDPASVAAAAEGALRALVDEHRKGLQLSVPGVTWDDSLCHLLAPALYSYEAERLGSHPVGQGLFSDAIKRAVPTGHTFKGLPLHFTSYEPTAIFRAWMQNEVASDVLRTRTFKGSLAIRLRVCPMADGVVSVWAMLAIAYRPDA